MLTDYNFRVADFLFTLRLPDGMNAESLLPSFRPFRVADAADGQRLFTFTALPPCDMPCDLPTRLIEETDNDMGHLRLFAIPDGYLVQIDHRGYAHRMIADADFSSIRAYLCPDDKNAGHALSSLVRIAFAQSILLHDGVSIHAAAVFRHGRAYLFMGRSGTGKSTHASLWIRHLPDTQLLNDDNPTVRIIDNRAVVYGTPWSGKTPCYKNLRFPIGGMVRLQQSTTNLFTVQEDVNAFIAIYPGCSIISENERLRNRLYDTISHLAGIVAVGIMDCRPDKEAALMCSDALTSNSHFNND